MVIESSSTKSDSQVLVFADFQNYKTKFISTSKKMGSIESKIKNGYSLNKKPMVALKYKEGVNPYRKSTSSKSSTLPADLDNTNSSQQQQSDQMGSIKATEKKLQQNSSQSVKTTSQYPYSSIGLITCLLGDQKLIGSGCLIGPNQVLTCAHNVWSFKEKKMSKNITFSPMFHSSNQAVTYQARKVYLAEELMSLDASGDDLLPFDYAVIELQCGNIEQDYGTLALDFDFKLTHNKSLTILGFNRQARDLSLFKLQGEVSQDHGLMMYDMSAGYGMSGAPIINYNDGIPQIVGIHIFCRQKHGKVERGGIKLSEKILKDLEKWCMRDEEEIDLREKDLGKDGLKHLSRHKWSNLTSLNISRNNFEGNTAKYLKRGHWKNLVNFDLGGNLIGKEGAQALAQSQMMAIVTLNLWGNCIGKGGAYCISMAGWENLTNLNLCNNNDIGDEGVEYLTHANWKRLNSLNLGKNGITFQGAQFVLEGKWPNLASLNLWGNELSGEESLLKSRLLQHFRMLKFLYF